MKNIYQIKIQVKNVRPSIYRTILVNEDVNFQKLHTYIQSIFGLLDYHLWEFHYGDSRTPTAITVKTNDENSFPWEEPKLEAKKIKLKKILKKEKDKCLYWYDFGDDWEFDITLQKIFSKKEFQDKFSGKKYPMLLKAKGPMLLEDVGGIHYWEAIIGLYEHIKSGKVLSMRNKDYIEDILFKIVSQEEYETEDWTEYKKDFVAIISELYKTDWEDFDIEKNYISL